MQAVGGKQGKPHTVKQGQMDLDQEDYYRQTKYIVKYCQELLSTQDCTDLRLKDDIQYSIVDKYDQWMNYTKIAADCNMHSEYV